MNKRVVISGCSGGGKSTLLQALAARGFATVAEPGRRIVRAELAAGGGLLPWRDPVGFARKALATALADFDTAPPAQWLFFDRSAIDAASALQHLTGEPALDSSRASYRYNPIVFLAPPWAALFSTDAERRHSFEAAVAECERLQRDYGLLGYKLISLPQSPVSERTDWLLAHVNIGVQGLRPLPGIKGAAPL